MADLLKKAEALSALRLAQAALDTPMATDEEERAVAHLAALEELVDSMMNEELPVEVYYE